MHNRDEASYKHFMKEMIKDIKESVKIAKEAGVKTTVMGVMQGVAFVRVHDVKENKRAIMMTEAVLGRKDL